MNVLLTCRQYSSVLRTFIYDPLCEWQKTKGRDLLSEKNKDTGEVTNEEVRTMHYYMADKVREL